MNAQIHRTIHFVPVALAALAGCGNSNAPPTRSTAAAGGITTGTGGGAAGCTAVVQNTPLGTTPGSDASLTAALGGFAAAWIENGEVIVALVDDNGIETARSQISSAGGQAALPSLVAAGDGFTALWSQGSTVMARALSSALAALGAPFVVAAGAAAEPRPAGAAIGDSVVATWMSSPGLVADLVAPGNMQQRGSANGWFPAIASDGQRAALSWSEGVRGGPVHVALLDAMNGGLRIDGSAALIKSMVFSQGTAFVGWEDVRTGSEVVQLAKVQLDQNAVLTTAVGSAPDGSANWPALAWNGSRLALAYYQFRDGPPSVFLQFFSGDLQPMGTELKLADHAKFPSAAWKDGELGVVYNTVQGPVLVSVVACH